MNRAAVIGAGLIGRAWAIVFARAGWQVALHDPVAGAAEAAIGLIRGSVADLAGYRLIDEPEAAVTARVSMAPDLAAALGGATLVQENSPERLEVKLALFHELDRLAAPDTILASSTSTIPASAFTEALAGRARCLVAHPVNPPYLIPLVELSPAPWTDPAVTARARALYEAAGQSPIVISREVGGFILNRLQGALLAEAFRLYQDGYVSTEDLDRTLKDGLGLRWSFMGPFETIDLNAPAGVRDYVARYGAIYHALQKEQADPRAWDGPALDRIEAERRAVLPAEALATRQAWRDRRLMALMAHKRKAAREID